MEDDELPRDKALMTFAVLLAMLWGIGFLAIGFGVWVWIGLALKQVVKHERRF